MCPAVPAPAIDRPARNHAAAVIASLLDGSVAWCDVPERLGPYRGPDRGVSAVHAELRAASGGAADGWYAAGTDARHELTGVLGRVQRFLRSDCRYRWDERGPVEIMGAYLGWSALSWFGVAGALAILGPGHEAVIASALLAMLLMYVLVAAMAVALMRRMWWRLAARREGADRAAWPFFTHAEARAAARVQDGSPW